MLDSATSLRDNLVSSQGISVIVAEDIIDDATADLFPGRIRDLMKKYKLTESQAINVREEIRNAKRAGTLTVGGIENVRETIQSGNQYSRN